MRILKSSSHGRGPRLVACLAVSAGICLWMPHWHVLAQDDPDAASPSEAKPQEATRKKKRHVAHRPAPRPTEPAHAPASQVAATSPAPAPAEGKTPAPIDFAAQLDKAGAAACRSQINALATSTMGSVEKFNTVSNWSKVDGDKRVVSLAIGQRYAAGSAVPFGLSQVVAAPNRQGGCDGFSVQVFPSPLSCAKLRDSIVAQHGQQIGDLAGIPLMQDAAGRTMLLPTAADTCVLIATRSVYPR